MAKQWYIIHTYSGHEAKAMKALLERAKAAGMEDKFDEVLIPEETVVEMVKGEKRTSKRKYFPGYILVRMDLTDETWHVVRGTPKITGFVDEVMVEKEKLRVMVQVFGRATPVVLDYTNVEKA